MELIKTITQYHLNPLIIQDPVNQQQTKSTILFGSRSIISQHRRVRLLVEEKVDVYPAI